MNVDNNHLILLNEGEMPPEGYTQVPAALQRGAMRKLAGRNEATVSRTSGGKLSRWAAGQRRKKQRTKRRKRGIKLVQDFCN